MKKKCSNELFGNYYTGFDIFLYLSAGAVRTSRHTTVRVVLKPT